ncbi:MAG: hypothetical protein M1824_003814 [Vezdaea acicularis]|nr:MAG: hypothetical protein M1824_003814 [Vezdaea acicularis]
MGNKHSRPVAPGFEIAPLRRSLTIEPQTGGQAPLQSTYYEPYISRASPPRELTTLSAIDPETLAKVRAEEWGKLPKSPSGNLLGQEGISEKLRPLTIKERQERNLMAVMKPTTAESTKYRLETEPESLKN